MATRRSGDRAGDVDGADAVSKRRGEVGGTDVLIERTLLLDILVGMVVWLGRTVADDNVRQRLVG